jgi:two-component system sensor histidine kinase UhpB
MTAWPVRWSQKWHLSLFEKVILVNSLLLIGEALAALWVTSHELETHHFFIDTLFVVLAALCILITNVVLLRATFRPLFQLLHTIREVGQGQTQARAVVSATSWEIGELAQAFNTMLESQETARREQTRAILQAQESERRRIGMELHDETGQNLTALLIHTEVLHQQAQQFAAEEMSEHARQQLEHGLQQLTRLTQISLEDVRVLAQQLRPSVLDDLGLVAAFRWLAEDSSQRLRLAVEVAVQARPEEIQTLPDDYGTALFRIAQESLTNVARHAHARAVTITLATVSAGLCLSIQDDGDGYQVDQQKSSMGLLGMRERATSLGGTLTIRSQMGQGTTVQAIVPLPDAP